MSEPIVVALTGDESLWFERFRGVVVEESKRSEASLIGRTRAFAGPDGARVDTTLGTSHERTHSIWLRSEEGAEREIEIPSHAFSSRAGHDVSVAWGARVGVERGYYVAAVNHTTGATWQQTAANASSDELSALGAVNMDGFWSKVVVVSLGLIAVPGLLAGVMSSAKDAVLLAFVMACGPAEIIAGLGLFMGVIYKNAARATIVEARIEALANLMQEDGGKRSNAEISARLSGEFRTTR
jgi:hypothetical protein